MIEFNNKEYNCSMEVTIDLIGGKYKALVLYHLGFGTKRFSDLKRSIPQATQKMLTQQLRDLEDKGLIIRTVYPQVPPKVEYSLSEVGLSLKPILEAMCDWGRAYMEK